MKVSRVPLNEEPIDGAATVEKYDRYAALFIRPEYAYTVSNILKHKINSGFVLDIGTGSGRLAMGLARALPNMSVIGLDISLDMLKQARVNTGKQNGARDIDYVRATAAQLPFLDQSMDIVTSYASLHHWRQPVGVFNEIWRVTKENGLILIRDNRRFLGNPFYAAGLRLISLPMNRQQRKMWPKSILASYTVEEVKQILAQSAIENYRVHTDMGGFDLIIEARKR
jgi:ubiquinone/menaquinone biosynthesis C-methylase UbiE